VFADLGRFAALEDVVSDAREAGAGGGVCWWSIERDPGGGCRASNLPLAGLPGERVDVLVNCGGRGL
jgi:hypothetical protein